MGWYSKGFKIHLLNANFSILGSFEDVPCSKLALLPHFAWEIKRINFFADHTQIFAKALEFAAFKQSKSEDMLCFLSTVPFDSVMFRSNSLILLRMHLICLFLVLSLLKMKN